jgi:hypothetical protein
MLSCAKTNTLDECKVFWGFDTKKSIVDFFENEKRCKGPS